MLKSRSGGTTAEQESSARTWQVIRAAAHDLKSPLAVLKMLSSQLEGVETAKRDILVHAISRVNEVANTLLDLPGWPEPAPLTLQKKDTEPRDAQALEAVCSLTVKQMVERLIIEKRLIHPRVELTLTDSLDIVVTVRAAQTSLMRILSNLLDNSLEAITENGSIQVQLNAIAGRLAIGIEDNGTGISSDVLAGLAGGRSMTTKPSGHGVGLYEAHRQLKRWGGQLHIEPAPNLGTRVTVHLRSSRSANSS